MVNENDPFERTGPASRAGLGDGGEPCPPGERKHPTQDGWECRPDGSSNTFPTQQHNCPSGTSWNEGEQRCIADECPEGQTWHNQLGRCVPKCPPGQDLAADGSCFDNPVDGGGGPKKDTYQPPKPPAPTKSPYDAAMAKQLYDTLSRMLSGEDQPFGPDTVARMQAAALESNKSQKANDERSLQKRLISAGLSRSGVAPSEFRKLDSSASADLSSNFRTIASTAVQGNYNARVTALNQAQQFLQGERANALSQDQLILSYARLNQEWNSLQAGFDQQWKIIQNGNEQDLQKLMICLYTGVC